VSAEGGSLFKFEGFGRYGETVAERGGQLAQAGFGPALLGSDNGFVEYAMLAGPPARAEQCDAAWLERLAEYCAFRVATQAAAAPAPVSLESMLQHNLRVEFGEEQFRPKLPLEKLVVADSRLMPYEWIVAGQQLVKTDGASHGDDHLFPGPTDIAWDLAGVVAEWELEGAQQEFFLAQYRRRSGDDAAARVPPYLLAYSVFRMACCRMGAAAMAAWEESHRLRREYLRHRRRVVSLLGLKEDRAQPTLSYTWPTRQAA
jgi:hypothetical protein